MNILFTKFKILFIVGVWTILGPTAWLTIAQAQEQSASSYTNRPMWTRNGGEQTQNQNNIGPNLTNSEIEEDLDETIPSSEVPTVTTEDGTEGANSPILIEPQAQASDSNVTLSIPSISTHSVQTSQLSSLNLSSVSSNICPGDVSQPIELRTLAFSLKCDIDLIFEYVYNNISYIPTFGSYKGAFGTFLDQEGNDIDQINLFLALLKAAGFDDSQFNIKIGYIRTTEDEVSEWLGIPLNTSAIWRVLNNGRIEWDAVTVWNPDGTFERYLDILHVWTTVTIGGTAYTFDPSFKKQVAAEALEGLGRKLINGIPKAA